MNEKNLEIKKISKPEKVYPKKEINSLDDMAVSSDEVSKEIESLDNLKESEKEISSLDEISGIKTEKPESFSKEEIETQRIEAKGTNEMLHKEFDKYLSDEKRRINISEITQFERNDDFREHILEKNPTISQEDLNSMAAYYDGEHIHVDADADPQKRLQHLSHEGLHVFSSQKIVNKYGKSLNDGMTEYYTKQLTPYLESLKNLRLKFDSETHKLSSVEDVTPKYYPKESEIVSMIHGHADPEHIARAYFQRDVKGLEDYVDASTGEKDTLKKISELMENKKWEEAKKLLLKRREI